MKQCFSLDVEKKILQNSLDPAQLGKKTKKQSLYFFFLSTVQEGEQNSVKDANPQSCSSHMRQLRPDKTA